MIQNSISGLYQSAENKQIDMKVDLNDHISVLADPNMVQAVVRNLVSNAIKFTPRGGSVVIRTEVKSFNTALIQICDTGVGIDKAELSKVFDICNTPHTKGTEGEPSTGLGLILVKDFIEKNKGSISLESTKGKGTTVSFTLPIC
jgi:signal transduction histidine kinase